MLEICLLGMAYLLGGVPMGVAVSALAGGADPRSGGSGNIGATNVARLNGWGPGALTLALDLSKGLLPTLLAAALLSPSWAGAVGLAAVVGHCWSIYHSFSGGKGVATAAGAMLALAPLPLAGAAAAWGGLFALTRKSSLAGLAAALLLPLLCALLRPDRLPVSLLITAVILLRHRPNIERLLSGTEPSVR